MDNRSHPAPSAEGSSGRFGFFRKRSFLYFRIILVLVILYLTKQTIFSSRSQLVSPEAVQPIVPAVSAIIPTRLEKVRPNQSLSSILAEHHVKSSEAHLVIEAIKGICQCVLFVGQDYFLELNPDSSLALFKLLSRDRLTYYQVVREETQYRADIRPRPLRKERVTLAGILQSSLYEAMAKAGERPELVINLIDIFAWDINWFVDPQVGDTFKLIFEKVYSDEEFMGYGKILSAYYKNREKPYRAYYFSPDSTVADYFDAQGVSLRKSMLKAPLAYRRISSRFSRSRFHPILKCRRPHLGVDYAASTGTPVKAAGDGRVLFAGVKGGYGKCVHLRHFNSYTTMYGHLSGFVSALRSGKTVKQGEVIGFVGSTGLSSGPHLDYRVKRGNQFVNPLTLSAPPVGKVPAKWRSDFLSLVERQDAALALSPTEEELHALAK
ncbi:MAG: hypothetical protein A2293_06245 [Elusimicrobia bacterium RIFOXYB2_FULL_49_7]|nr:MAG: hypothetical protein A2293_06245 [Elusimicrobia bacterium RIFOXYB2_FULL_49_7]